MSAVRRLLTATIALLLLGAFGGCRAEPPAAGGTGAERDPTRTEALSASLAGLETRPPGAVADYDRDAFGSAWADVDGNGCNQRDDVLLRDALADTVLTARQGACDHDVLAGSWRDPYTGAVLTFDDLKDPVQAQAIQVDHVVPLAEAWLSGASVWTPDRRLDFANDLPGLLAVDGEVNQEKGADDPARWQPDEALACAYAERWIDVKDRWALSVDEAERAALEEMLAGC